jgi:TIR domain
MSRLDAKTVRQNLKACRTSCMSGVYVSQPQSFETSACSPLSINPAMSVGSHVRASAFHLIRPTKLPTPTTSNATYKERHPEEGAVWDTGAMAGDNLDFFISHAGTDRAWAEWVAWQLTEAGYTVELDVWDWAAGQNFVIAMSDALERCDRVVALFSAAYFDRSRYTTEEWTAASLHVPGMAEGKLVPVRVRCCTWTYSG